MIGQEESLRNDLCVHFGLTTVLSMKRMKPDTSANIFYMHTKFGDSHFSRFKDMIAGVKIENGSCDPDHARFRGGLSSDS